MDDARNHRRRAFLEICASFTQIIRILTASDSGNDSAGILRLLEIILYTLKVICLPLPPPIPKYDQVLFDGQHQERRLRGRDCWSEYDGARFWTLTGETPHSLTMIVNDLQRYMLSRMRFPRRLRGFKLTVRNRILMVFIWLRQYPREELLAAQFGVTILVVS